MRPIAPEQLSRQIWRTSADPGRPGRSGTAAVALCGVLLIAGIGPAFAQDDCTNVGCNSTSITSVLFPDTQATIYVNLRTICGSGVLNSCQVNFLSPPTLDPKLKCEELVEALSQGDCLAAGYEVSANLCTISPPALVVTDPDFPQSLVEVGITCDPNVFTQTGQGQPICDYEGDVITPGDKATGAACISDGSVAVDVTIRGTATGEEIVTTIPSTPHFSVLLELQRDQPPINLQVLTGNGMSDQEIVQLAAEQILGLGVRVEVLNDGKTLRLSREEPGAPPIGIGAATNDVGITHAVVGGQTDMLPDEFPPPFASLGECISTWIDERCSGLTGRARAACNHAQQAECQLLFE